MHENGIEISIWKAFIRCRSAYTMPKVLSTEFGTLLIPLLRLPQFHPTLLILHLHRRLLPLLLDGDHHYRHTQPLKVLIQSAILFHILGGFKRAWSELQCIWESVSLWNHPPLSDHHLRRAIPLTQGPLPPLRVPHPPLSESITGLRTWPRIPLATRGPLPPLRMSHLDDSVQPLICYTLFLDLFSFFLFCCTYFSLVSMKHSLLN